VDGGVCGWLGREIFHKVQGRVCDVVVVLLPRCVVWSRRVIRSTSRASTPNAPCRLRTGLG